MSRYPTQWEANGKPMGSQWDEANKKRPPGGGLFSVADLGRSDVAVFRNPGLGNGLRNEILVLAS